MGRRMISSDGAACVRGHGREHRAPRPQPTRLEPWCRRCPDRPPLVIPAAPHDMTSLMLPSAPLLLAPLGGPCSCLYLGVKSPPVLKTSRCEHRAAYCRPGPHTAPQQLRRMTAIARSSLTRTAASAATCLRTEPRCAHPRFPGSLLMRLPPVWGPEGIEKHLTPQSTTCAAWGGSCRRWSCSSRRARRPTAP